MISTKRKLQKINEQITTVLKKYKPGTATTPKLSTQKCIAETKLMLYDQYFPYFTENIIAILFEYLLEMRVEISFYKVDRRGDHYLESYYEPIQDYCITNDCFFISFNLGKNEPDSVDIQFGYSLLNYLYVYNSFMNINIDDSEFCSIQKGKKESKVTLNISKLYEQKKKTFPLHNILELDNFDFHLIWKG